MERVLTTIFSSFLFSNTSFISHMQMLFVDWRKGNKQAIERVRNLHWFSCSQWFIVWFYGRQPRHTSHTHPSNRMFPAIKPDSYYKYSLCLQFGLDFNFSQFASLYLHFSRLKFRMGERAKIINTQRTRKRTHTLSISVAIRWIQLSLVLMQFFFVIVVAIAIPQVVNRVWVSEWTN